MLGMLEALVRRLKRRTLRRHIAYLEWTACNPMVSRRMRRNAVNDLRHAQAALERT